MACGVCEHCDNPVKPGDGTVRQGYSYHLKCCKCYICSETNLHDAEVFKGAIFCAGCSKRIFQGCMSARKAKTTRIIRRPYPGRRPNTRFRKVGKKQMEIPNVITSITDEDFKFSTSLSRLSELSMRTKVIEVPKTKKNMKKDSTDMGMTTDVTQELLMQITCMDKPNDTRVPLKPRKKNKTRKESKERNEYSDLRIAELGASTEIAHMTLTTNPHPLRRHSALPIIIKSRSEFQNGQKSKSSSLCTPSHSSKNSDSEEWSKHSSVGWLDRRVGSILKLPYTYFKKNVLDRSSLISIILSDSSKICMLKRFKNLFHNDILEHHKKGYKKLYSTINTKKTPYKLGWLDIQKEAMDSVGCKHCDQSHSYRCMRAQVMKLAGPTRSELALIRQKLKSYLFTDFFRNILDYSRQYSSLITSQT